jgi:hypothetical protein
MRMCSTRRRDSQTHSLRNSMGKVTINRVLFPTKQTVTHLGKGSQLILQLNQMLAGRAVRAAPTPTSREVRLLNIGRINNKRAIK